MTTAYRIIIFAQVIGERRGTQGLNDVHALLIQVLDALVYRSMRPIVVCVTEALAPMAEIGWYHKKIRWIHKVCGQQAAVLRLLLRIERAHKYRHNGELVLEANRNENRLAWVEFDVATLPYDLLFHHFSYIRQMHFNGVLILVRLHVHPWELTRLLQLGINCNWFQLNSMQVFNDFYTLSVSILRSYNGVLYFFATERAQPRSRTWWDGPNMKMRLLKERN